MVCVFLQSALWGFNGGTTKLGNPYRAINVDVLHQGDIGIFKTLVSILRDMSNEGAVCTSKAISELDKRLATIQKESRYSHYRVPGTDKGGYFSSNANFAAFEHRAIMQVKHNCSLHLVIVFSPYFFYHTYKVHCSMNSEQVIVFCLINLFEDDVIKAFVLFLKWYKLASRSPEHTNNSLELMDDIMNR